MIRISRKQQNTETPFKTNREASIGTGILYDKLRNENSRCEALIVERN